MLKCLQSIPSKSFFALECLQSTSKKVFFLLGCMSTLMVSVVKRHCWYRKVECPLPPRHGGRNKLMLSPSPTPPRGNIRRLSSQYSSLIQVLRTRYGIASVILSVERPVGRRSPVPKVALAIANTRYGILVKVDWYVIGFCWRACEEVVFLRYRIKQ
jgi:hypothetical protein